MIGFVNLSSQNEKLLTAYKSAIDDIVKNSYLINGKYLKKFETRVAKKLGLKNCVGVANGTDALTIALVCTGINKDDEVITAANSFVANSESIINAGAKPVFVDVDEYYGMDAKLLEKKITSKTKAVVAVHLYGQACDIKKIHNICKKNNITLIEDASQSHFAKFNDKYTGTFGDLACYSFYPSKNLGALGDAGAIVTDNDELAEKIRIYSNHGAKEKNNHLVNGVNSRLDDIQAAVLDIKLDYIEAWNSKRHEVGVLYNKIFEDNNFIITPKIRSNAEHIFHLYVVQVERREELREYLQKHDIQTGIHYPYVLPLLPYHTNLYNNDDFPNSVNNMDKLLSLPLHSDLKEKDIIFVAEKIINFFKNTR